MQSLKSTAFAVTLLAISFGLYCVSSTDREITNDQNLVGPIVVDDGDSAEMIPESKPEEGSSSRNFVTTAPMTLGAENDTGPSTGPSNGKSTFPDLPRITAPELTLPPVSFSKESETFKSPETPKSLELPSFSATPPPTASKETESKPDAPIQLPQFATRQPEQPDPAKRDEGLIDALKTNQFDTEPAANQASAPASPESNGSAFKSASPVAENPDDRSFNSQASGVSGSRGFSGVSTAGGSVGNAAMTSSPEPSPKTPAAVWKKVDQLVEADNYLMALEELTRHYSGQDFRGPQRQKLVAWLDALAGKVIYSTEHHIAQRPYVVQNGDTLESISEKLKVPSQVIYNINRSAFKDDEVSPGMELKVIKGPFHAEINMDSSEMTLFVADLYAGRFPVTIGISGRPGPGNYQVAVKSPEGYKYRDENGIDHPPESPQNAYGPYWIGLSSSLCLHAVDEGTKPGHSGCIGLSEKDAKDIFGILSKESQINIVR